VTTSSRSNGGAHYGRAVSPPSEEVPLSAPTAFVAYNLPRQHRRASATSTAGSIGGTTSTSTNNTRVSQSGRPHLPLLQLNKIKRLNDSKESDSLLLSKTAPNRLNGNNNGSNGRKEEKELNVQNGSSLVRRMLRDDARIDRIAANINQSGYCSFDSIHSFTHSTLQ
jgi:hypothetical protein